MSAIAQFRTEPEGAPDWLMLSAAMEACPASLAVVERGECGRVLHANPAFVQLFGYSQNSEIHGRSWPEFVIALGVFLGQLWSNPRPGRRFLFT